MLTLQREFKSALGTIGYFRDTKPHRIFTLERPWVPSRFNVSPDMSGLSIPPCGTKGVSCIPPGRYRLEAHDSEAHPHTVALVNEELWVYHFEEQVPPNRRGHARTAVLIHPANFVSELRGCIAPGWTRTGFVVQESRKAFAQLSLAWPDEIEILDPPGV